MIDRLIYKVINKIRFYLNNLVNKYNVWITNKTDINCGTNESERDIPTIIVSFTSYPKRLDKIDMCIKSILNQSYKPDRIVLWLGSDTSKDVADKYLKKYTKYGLEYYIDSENNYLSHKKYIYSFNNFKDSIIITIDDDLIYPPRMVESLIKKYKKHPNCIISRRVHKITFDKKHRIKRYSEWIRECFYIFKPSHKLCATTGAGALFPPFVLRKDEVTNFNLIEKYALTADDIWLKMMAVRYKVKVLWAGNFLQMPAIIDNTGDNLSNINVAKNQNDKYIEKIIEDFNISYIDFN